MTPRAIAEFNDMLKCYGYVDVTILQSGKMSNEIQLTSFSELLTLVSLHGPENVFF